MNRFQKSPTSLKEGAVFIADAHFSNKRPKLEAFIESLQAPQLFLMGDIFDMLFGQIPLTHQDNASLIKLLNARSKQMEIVYFEGNHDFNLQELFPHMKIYQREQQPQLFEYEGQKILLAHGDRCANFGYLVYTFFIRNRFILSLINTLDRKNRIYKALKRSLEKKRICKKMPKMDQFIALRYECYKKFSYDLIVEGHFHQNYQTKNYINLPSFACGGAYMVLEKEKFVLKG